MEYTKYVAFYEREACVIRYVDLAAHDYAVFTVRVPSLPRLPTKA